MKEFDEQEAIQFIRKKISKEAARYSDDDILNVIDMIWDFYDENGMLDVDVDDDADDRNAVSAIVEYVTKMSRKDKLAVLPEALYQEIIEAEMDYEDSLLDD